MRGAGSTATDSLFSLFTAIIFTAVLVRDSASGRSPDAAALALCIVATAALSLLLHLTKHRVASWRSALICAHRLTLVYLLMGTSLADGVLHQPPTPGWLGLLVDALHLLIGGRATRLFFLGACIYPGLAAHLAAHTLCLAIALWRLSDNCSQPLLDSALMEQRLDVLHHVLGAPLVGVLPPTFPGPDRHRRCATALVFLCVFVGWVLPTYLVLRAHCRELRYRRAAAVRHGAGGDVRLGSRQRRESGKEQPGSSKDGEPGAGHSGLRTESPPAPHDVGPRPISQRYRNQPSCAEWAYDNVFLASSPAELQAVAWALLASLTWMLSSVAAGCSLQFI